uniref:T9SS type A sorting domain-containing protein n=1 Tax=uncultured Draconibacterium sp. TaxID=1573823 RepID=UPI003216631F
MKKNLIFIFLIFSGYIVSATDGTNNLSDSTDFYIVCPSNTSVECPYPRAFSVQSIEEFENLGGVVYSNPYEITSFWGDEVIDSPTLDSLFAYITYTVKNSNNETKTCQQVIHLSDWSYPEMSCPPNDTVNKVEDAPPPFQTLEEFMVGGGYTSITCENNSFINFTSEYLDSTTHPFSLIRYYEFFDCINNLCVGDYCTHTIVINPTTNNEHYLNSDRNIVVFPSPAFDIIKIKFTNNTVYQVRILNMKGELQFEREIEPASSNYIETFDISSLPSGRYLVSITSEGEHFVQKIITY